MFKTTLTIVMATLWLNFSSKAQQPGQQKQAQKLTKADTSKKDTVNLNEVQIIGYGKTTRLLNTGSITSITAKQIEQQPVSNVLSALSGRMPGVVVQTTNGLPGGNINIQIRGKGSITAGTNPLYIIDDVPFESTGIASGSSLASGSIVGAISPLNSLNPTDIESITVLKDADATAIYGSRGANGIVLIQTKKGKPAQNKFSINYNTGINQAASFPDLLNLEQYQTIRKEAFANDGRTPSNDPNSVNYAPDLTVWGNGQTNWAKYLYGKTAHVNTLQASLTGGSIGTTYNASANYRTESTILAGNNRYRRGTALFGLQHQSQDKKLTVSFSNTLSLDENRTANPSNSTSTMIVLAPNYPLRDAAGNYNWSVFPNPEAQLLATSTAKTQNNLSNLNFSYSFFTGFSFKTSMGYSRIHTSQVQLYPQQAQSPGSINYSVFGQNSSQSLIVEPQLNYQHQLGKGQLSILLGATWQNRNTDSQYIKASNFSNEGLMENLASAGTIDTRSSNTTSYKYASLYSRVKYSLKERYILNLTMRRDGSSKFGPGNQYGNFGAVGAGWIISNEKWLKPVKFLSYLKLRASYGLTGNDQITDYQYLSTYSTSGNIYQNIAALAPTRISNANFKWESTKKLELAMESGFLNNRILFNVNHYRNRSSDQLVNYTLPRMTGFASYQANLPAVVANTGWEFEINSTNIRQNAFSWQTTFNLTLPHTELVSFQNFSSSSYANTLRIGEDISRIYGFRILNIDPVTGNAIYAPVPGSTATTPDQYQSIGKQTPYFYGGIGNSFSYKNWQLSIFGQFARQKAFGGLINTPGSIRNNYTAILNRWQNSDSQTNIPKATLVNDGRFSLSSANYFDASYFRLKNIALSCNLPARWFKALKIEQIKLTAECQNALTFWDKDSAILDPESGAITAANISLPPVKSFVFGLHVTL